WGRGGHADRSASSRTHAHVPGDVKWCVADRPRRIGDVGASGRGNDHAVWLRQSFGKHEPADDRLGRGQPASHELPAVPLRELHHLALRNLPEPDLGGAMADPFVAEIRIFPFNFPPKGWAWCDGQLMPISQNTALFSLLGTTYGGDGKSTFALPDLQGRAPMHPGQGPGLSLHDLGETGGSETVTLLESEIPAHPHSLMASTASSTKSDPTNNSIARIGSGAT